MSVVDAAGLRAQSRACILGPSANDDLNLKVDSNPYFVIELAVRA